MAGKPGRSGRRAKPDSLRQLQGPTLNSTRERKRAASAATTKPAAPVQSVPPPPHLSEAAREVWSRLMPEFTRLGLLTALDVDLFATYCSVRARLIEADAHLKERGVLITTVAGNLIQNPAFSVANRCIAQLQSLSTELGLTFSSRARLGIPKLPGIAAARSRPALDMWQLSNEQFDLAIDSGEITLDDFLAQRPPRSIQ